MAEVIGAVPLGMAGLIFPLFAWFYAIFAKYELKPEEMKGIAVAELIGFISLLIQSVWHTIANPFGAVVSMLFTTIPAMYAFIWLLAFFTHWFGLDPKPLGDCALCITISECIATACFFVLGIGLPWQVIIDLIIYAPFTTIGFYLANHGYGGKAVIYYVGVMCFLAWLATIDLQFWGAGILPAYTPPIV